MAFRHWNGSRAHWRVFSFSESKLRASLKRQGKTGRVLVLPWSRVHSNCWSDRKLLIGPLGSANHTNIMNQSDSTREIDSAIFRAMLWDWNMRLNDILFTKETGKLSASVFLRLSMESCQVFNFWIQYPCKLFTKTLPYVFNSWMLPWHFLFLTFSFIFSGY